MRSRWRMGWRTKSPAKIENEVRDSLYPGERVVTAFDDIGWHQDGSRLTPAYLLVTNSRLIVADKAAHQGLRSSVAVDLNQIIETCTSAGSARLVMFVTTTGRQLVFTVLQPEAMATVAHAIAAARARA